MRKVFLDGASNTPLDKNVLKRMKPFLNFKFVGNSASTHNFGINSSIAVETSRNEIAQILCCQPNEVFFTSGATESNNWIVSTISKEFKTKEPHIICSAIEHSSILNVCNKLAFEGVKIDYVYPNENGVITAEAVKKLITDDTVLICVMAVNNETGVANPINKIAAIARRHHVRTLVDCTQLMGYGGKNIHLCEVFPRVDYFSFSAHKFYGPTGVGCLIARKNAPLKPFIVGGSQEFGKRGGTSNTAGIVGAAAALKEIEKEGDRLIAKYNFLYSYLLNSLKERKINFKLNAEPTHKNIISLNFSDAIKAENLAAMLAPLGIAVSAGSACDAEHSDISDFNPSHVLLALGLEEKDIRNTVRVSFTKYTNTKDLDSFVDALEEIASWTL